MKKLFLIGLSIFSLAISGCSKSSEKSHKDKHWDDDEEEYVERRRHYHEDDNDDDDYGHRKQRYSGRETAPHKLRVSASRGRTKELAPQGNNTYVPSNIVDGNLSTGWAVGNVQSEDFLRGSIYGPIIHLKEDAVIDYIVFYNGYGKNSQSFKNNTRAGWVKIYRATNGQPRSADILYEGKLSDTSSPQRLTVRPEFDSSEPVSDIIIQFSDETHAKFYEGKKWDDLVISEIEFWGH